MKSVRVDLVVHDGARSAALEGLLVRLPGSVWALPGATVAAGATLEAAASRRPGRSRRACAASRLEQLYTFDRDGGEGVRSPTSAWSRPSATR